MILVFDTETTGKADFRAPASAPHQPKLVQLGAQLLDDDLSVRAEMNLIVRPDGWEIPAEASAVHGITTEIAKHCGFGLSEVLGYFSELSFKARDIVAHNYDFYNLIITAAQHHIGNDPEWDEGMNAFCTMQAMTPIMDLPGPYGPKWPKLTEAYKHCTGKDLECAHDAMADVRGCAEVYRWLKKREQTQLQPTTA